MGVRRTKHAVYDLKYHLVWIPKYRKQILSGEVSEYLKDVFQRIAEEYEFKIDTMEVVEDHVHIFVEAPPVFPSTVGTGNEECICAGGIQEVP